MPQTLVSTGASYWGLQGKEYPWTIGWQPDYIAEGRLYGLHIKANHNGKKIAILYQNDDYGKDYLYGVRAALGKSYADANVVAQEAVEVDGDERRVADDADPGERRDDLRALRRLPTPTVRAIATGKALGFNPEQIYMNSVSAIKPRHGRRGGERPGAPYVNGIAHRRVPQGSDRTRSGTTTRP